MAERYSSKDIGRRFGIQDDDLKTPGHDALLLWVDANASEIANRATGGQFVARDCVWEMPISRRGFTVGYWDAWINTQRAPDADPEKWIRGIGVEIKTTIPSLGELVRQLRTYQEYTMDAREVPVVVVSPDARWATQLRSQGFFFIQPPDPRNEQP